MPSRPQSPSMPKQAQANGIKAAQKARKTKPRGVDPTTCEHEYSTDELEFMAAIEAYKHKTGRKFPTWSEVLAVIISLGYRKP